MSVNKDLFKRYFDNNCTTEEREQVMLWLEDPSHRDEVLQFMDEEWVEWNPSAAALKAAADEMNLPFGTLLRQARAHEESSPGRIRWLSGGKMRIVRIASGVAASLLFLVAGAYIGYQYKGKPSQAGKAPIYYATAQTLRGQRSKVVLADGSEIYLNAESKLSFSNEVSAHQVVYLEGEAFFKVPEKEKPLIVKTRDLVASTKGSQFNISAFPKDSTVTISVQNGKTEISTNIEKIFPLMALRIAGHDTATVIRTDSPGEKQKPKTMPMAVIRRVVVNANESVTFDKTNKLTTPPARLTEEELKSWKDGFMYFNRADSAGVVDKLQRWFDVEVILDTDQVPIKTLNCGFRNPTLTEVLTHISKELNLEYRIEGKKVYLNRRHI
jgi:transmembrane sensor